MGYMPWDGPDTLAEVDACPQRRAILAFSLWTMIVHSTNGSSPPSSDGRLSPLPTDTPASDHVLRHPGMCTRHRSVCDSLWTPKRHENPY
jgi:hypothetical protein